MEDVVRVRGAVLRAADFGSLLAVVAQARRSSPPVGAALAARLLALSRETASGYCC